MFKKTYLTYLLAFILIACAQEQPLTGGKQDLNAPKIFASNPRNMQKRFRGDRVVFYFDRYIKLGNTQNIVINPTLEQAPKILTYAKELELRFKQKLKPNTTYTVNLGDAIISFREEKAIGENLKLTFSTGREIDSSEIKGKVILAQDASPQKGILVMLYSKTYDSIVRKEKPIYFAKTNEKGEYAISSIAQGKYKVFALQESNNNYLFDSPKEKIDFLDSLVEITSSNQIIDNINFEIFEEETDKFFVQDYSHKQVGKVSVLFNKPLDTISVSVKNFPALPFRTYWSKRKDSLTIWMDEISEEKEVKFYLSARVLKDTLKLKPMRFKTPKYTDGEEPVLQVLDKSFKAKIGKPLTLSFNRPVAEINLEKFKFIQLPDSIRLTEEDLNCKIRENDPTKVDIMYPWKKGDSFQITLFKGAFMDAYNNVTDLVQNSFNAEEEKVETGLSKIVAQIDLSELSKQFVVPQYLVELLNEKNELLQRIKITATSKVTFADLKEGKYKMRLIFDSNANGYWDTGNYKKKLHAERVSLYNDLITVKKGWDQDIVWKFKM